MNANMQGAKAVTDSSAVCFFFASKSQPVRRSISSAISLVPHVATSDAFAVDSSVSYLRSSAVGLILLSE